MSYSRWGDSCWYTFWGSNDDKFQICGVPNSYGFSYEEIRDDVTKCIKKIKTSEPDKYSDAEFIELKELMKEYEMDYYEVVAILSELSIRELLDRNIESYDEIWRSKELNRRFTENLIPDENKLEVLTMMGDNDG